MKCADCGGETRVLETRLASKGLVVARRRRCEGCGDKVTTVEIVQGEGQGAVGQVTVSKVRVAKPKVAKVPSRNDAQGLKAKATARRRLEELRDARELEGDETMTMDDLRNELGW